HGIALDPRGRRRFVELFLTDARRMDILLVAQIHEVVDHQPIVASDVKEPAAIRPLAVFGPSEVVQSGGIRARRIPRPYPHKPVALDDRKSANRRKASYALTRHRDRLAVAAHFESVIPADELALGYRAERQRRAAVRTEILERGGLAVRATIENDRLAADPAAQRLVIDFIGGAGDVPRIFRIHINSSCRAGKKTIPAMPARHRGL